MKACKLLQKIIFEGLKNILEPLKAFEQFHNFNHLNYNEKKAF